MGLLMNYIAVMPNLFLKYWCFVQGLLHAEKQSFFPKCKA